MQANGVLTTRLFSMCYQQATWHPLLSGRGHSPSPAASLCLLIFPSSPEIRVLGPSRP